ncbi:ABC transporter substrate-binding protein [Verminephrobacter eiseniae]|uniref:ABC transporter substrate-binding protein n=1 Tax=Verminephrobacter eiseniae TaxID=364317 RepID=UPI0010E46C7C|nr:ABC transporter substrate-binding protein [Verminephrobacter eiseniae]KAB7598085.1 ABC transporter substrate-binding protein [Verminephrobacter sp. Larva24]MCW5232511.1 ABC transporter substrate-binding protein [Verminephrobacter eiseniae]MCW5295923.1 ABC transporter substrate-binding protein [Verminephrobacter eiseniae]MCW8184032.1 ABC transporter substrate-binding protein [Verminephrobacter eiseniae]MCW8221574.1 ABC transporter substrate-binding protein [Verminephrobacter eiseniae]
MNDQARNNPSRRRALKVAATGVGTLAAAAWLRYARAQSRRIVIRDDGGVYNRAYNAVFYKPFTEKTGIECLGAQANAEPIAQIRSMVETRNYTWDMAKISQPAILLLTQGGKVYLDKHQLENDPAVRSIPAHFMSPYGVGTNVYSTVLAYRTDAFKGRKAPNSWADFWNLKDFPGRRALRKHPFDTLEEASMAAGVPAASLYPLDIDRALAHLDKIKPGIDVWWNSGAQVEQMLKSGEVDMLATWVSRPQSAIADGAPVAIVWNQNLWGLDSWAILAGTPQAQACREFIKFSSDPKRMAALTGYLPAGVTQPEAFRYIRADVARNCPSHADNIGNGVQINARYWLDNQAAVTERFNAWILQ